MTPTLLKPSRPPPSAPRTTHHQPAPRPSAPPTPARRSLRGCPDNQRLLASLPAASEVLRAALAGYGPCWAPAKADLHALLIVLARLQVGGGVGKRGRGPGRGLGGGGGWGGGACARAQ